ncbi:MAG: 30S ribosomal protein S17 [Candidatus Bathyarchaeia archaeon]
MVKLKGIGLGIPALTSENCGDRNCPFHGLLTVRRRMLEGEVVSAKMQNTVIVRRDYTHYIPKYMRYERRRSRIPAHNPPCIAAKEGDTVKIAECRPLSKTVSFVVVEKVKREGKE